MNAGMEQYLRIFTSHQHDNWVQWLPLVMFAAYNRALEATMCSPFFCVTGVDPQMTFDETAGDPQDSGEVHANQEQAMLQQIHEHLCVEMGRSQDIMEGGANKK
jgi:hypothetical protein